jgi:heme b synthase
LAVATPDLRLIAWEITRSCNLKCAHCRASSMNKHYQDELSTRECFSLIDDIVKVGKPILIFTGGEPLFREDFFDIAKYAAAKGLRIAVGSNGTLVTRDMASRMKNIPVSRLGVSVDFPSPSLQDEFRGVAGAFDAAIEGINNAVCSDIEVQINCTVTKMNVDYLEELLYLALDLGAVAFHPFMLVPTGRGKELEDKCLSPGEHERVLNWIYDKQEALGDRIFFKPTDAPHYMRIKMQRDGNRQVSLLPVPHQGMNSISRGCLAGIGFCFISNTGRVQGCGYLDIDAGNIRERCFKEIWYSSPLFNNLRNYSNIKGKCGICEFKEICGGCRARAFEASGDYLAEEPYCVYQPKTMKISSSSDSFNRESSV